MSARRRSPRRTRRPDVRPTPWGDRTFPAPKPAPSSTSPFAGAEQWLHRLLDARAITGLTGSAGSWQATLPSGDVVAIVSIDVDPVERAILGASGR